MESQIKNRIVLFAVTFWIVNKLKVLANSHTGSSLILAKLEEWLPTSGSTEADAIVCIDENTPGSVILAENITLNEYHLRSFPADDKIIKEMSKFVQQI